MSPARRGRPRLNSAAADRLIARSVHQLAWWGFSLRPKRGSPEGHSSVFEAVALAFQNAAAGDPTLRRGDRNERLSAKRVEQIYARWNALRPTADALISRGSLNRYTVASLRERLPTAARCLTLAALAEIVLRNGGTWPELEPENDANAIIPGGLALTPSGTKEEERELEAMPRMRQKAPN